MTKETNQNMDWTRFEGHNLPHGSATLFTKNGTVQSEIDEARVALAEFLMRKLKNMQGVDPREAQLLCACFARMLPDEQVDLHLAQKARFKGDLETNKTAAFEALAVSALTLVFQLNAIVSAGVDD